MVEDFTVVNDPEISSLVAQGLMPAGHVDDTEPPVTEVSVFIMIEPAVIGAPMLDRLRHALENLARPMIRRDGYETGNTTHIH